ncbi:hypothetical protein [Nocardia sp. NPDC047654]|uniref:hypothetical protein n=1 Tax=Nocardia sp. NPDC047654 TaxID=3364314 RepID=UPI00371AA2B4
MLIVFPAAVRPVLRWAIVQRSHCVKLQQLEDREDGFCRDAIRGILGEQTGSALTSTTSRAAGRRARLGKIDRTPCLRTALPAHAHAHAHRSRRRPNLRFHRFLGGL